MLILLNAGFGDELGPELLHEIKKLGFDGIRQDVVAMDAVRPLVSEVFEAGLFGLFVVNWGGVTAELAQEVARVAEPLSREYNVDYAIEIGNELNIAYPAQRLGGIDIPARGVVSPAAYGPAFVEIADAIRRIDSLCNVVTAGISNTGKDAQGWIRGVNLQGRHCTIGYHGYRTDDDPRPEAPQKGFGSRDQEFDALKLLAAGRPLWNTEVGFHTAERRRGLFNHKKYRLSDAEATSYLRREFDVSRKHAVGLTCVFQLNDGTRDEPEGRYGIRDVHGNWKPQAGVASWPRQ